MYILLNEQQIFVNTTQSGDRLSLSFISSDLVGMYMAFQPNTLPEITLYDESKGGVTSAIYANHRVLSIHGYDNGRIQVDLQIDPLEISEARRLSEALAVQVQEALENNNVLDEILAMLADHENRIKALEPKEPDEEEEIIDEEEEIVNEEGGDTE